MRAAGLEPLVTREPGGSPGAEEIRKLLVSGAVARWDPITELLLFSAARRDHVMHTIEPALAQGTWVISDRFTDSTLAYQGYGHGLGREACLAAQRLAIGDFAPDFTVILDIPASLGLERVGKRRGNETRFERMDPAFHERVHAGFLDIARHEPKRCLVIDATGPVQDVQWALRKAIAERFGVAL
jgi:dTMP kinase